LVSESLFGSRKPKSAVLYTRSGPGFDPDLMGSHLDPDCESGSRFGSRRAKRTHKYRKSYLINFIFEMLDVFFCGLKASPVA
jgi:hypothetical protein